MSSGRLLHSSAATDRAFVGAWSPIARAAQWQNIAAMIAPAGGRFRLIGTISVAFGCPFEGKVDPAAVVSDVEHFLELGVERVALGDTTGMATPLAVKNIISRLNTDKLVPIAHFTTDLVNLFESMGIDTGIDLEGLLATAEFCEQALGRELYGRVRRSGLNPLKPVAA